MIWGQAVKNWGQLAGWGAKTAASAAWRSPTGKAAIAGAGAGALWGAASSDTSVLGGMAMGALGGAGMYRYGIRPGMATARGLRAGGRSAFGGSMMANRDIMSVGSVYGSAVGKAVMKDVRGTKMAANKAVNRIGSTLKGWSGGDIGSDLMNAYGYLF